MGCGRNMDETWSNHGANPQQKRKYCIADFKNQNSEIYSATFKKKREYYSIDYLNHYLF